MMRGSIGRYRKPNGDEEIRIHFPEWHLPDGRVFLNVSVFPHCCGTCVGGDHTHVEMHDMREPIAVIKQHAVQFSKEHKAAIDRLLIEKSAVDALTGELVRYLGFIAEPV